MITSGNEDVSEHQEVAKKIKLKNISTVLNFQYALSELESPTISSITNNIIESPYYINKPYLLYLIDQNNYTYVDPYFNLIAAKSKLKYEIENLKMQYSKVIKKSGYDIDRFEVYLKMQDILNHDPDKYFCNSYNWYYSGGNLDVYNENNDIIIFHVENATNLCTSKLNKKKLIWKVKHKRKLIESSNKCHQHIIYEIKSILQNKNLILCSRSWKDITLYRINDFDSKECYSDIIFKYSHKYPLTSFAFHKNKPNEFVTLDVLQNIKIWNTEKSINKTVNAFNEEKQDQCWNRVEYLEENQLIYVNNFSYNLYDIRIGDFVKKQKHDYLHQKYRNLCVNKNMLNNIYLTSENCTYNYDLRNCSLINKWTHLLTENAYLSDMHVNNNLENTICLATRDEKEKILFGLEGDKIIMPKKLPTLHDSFSECLTYKSLDVPHYIIRRLNLSTTGLKFIHKDDRLSVLSSNSTGDLFINEIQNLCNKTQDNEMEICTDQFSECGKQCLNNLENSEILNFIDKLVISNRHLILDRKSTENIHNNKSDEILEKLRNQIKNRVSNCKTTLQDVWEFELPIENIEKIDASVNVEKWLNTINESSQTSIPEAKKTTEKHLFTNFLGLQQKSFEVDENF